MQPSPSYPSLPTFPLSTAARHLNPINQSKPQHLESLIHFPFLNMELSFMLGPDCISEGLVQGRGVGIRDMCVGGGGTEMGWWFGGKRGCGDVFGTRWGGAKGSKAWRRKVGHRQTNLVTCGLRFMRSKKPKIKMHPLNHLPPSCHLIPNPQCQPLTTPKATSPYSYTPLRLSSYSDLLLPRSCKSRLLIYICRRRSSKIQRTDVRFRNNQCN